MEREEAAVSETEDERVAEIKDPVVTEKTLVTLTADLVPTEEAVTENQVITLNTEAPNGFLVRTTAETAFLEAIKEMSKRSQEILIVSWWTTGSRVAKVKIQVHIDINSEAKNLAQQKLNEDLDNYWKKKGAEEKTEQKPQQQWWSFLCHNLLRFFPWTKFRWSLVRQPSERQKAALFYGLKGKVRPFL